MSSLKRTALYEEHLKLHAKMVPFAGWEMPVSYKGIIEEHLSVRNSAGIFDIGHMGIIDVTGKDALTFLLHIATNDALQLEEMECQYSILCNELGGVIDDILVYRLDGFHRLVVNASNTDKVLIHLKNQAKNLDVNIEHRKDISILSLQGPCAKELIGLDIKHNHCKKWENIVFGYKFDKDGILISRTGYTGEDGFEFFIENDSHKEYPNQIWEYFLDKGVIPCGLGARDTLRLEAGLPLYGHEYDEATTPIEVGYSWAVKFNHEFVGREALLKQKENGVKKKLVGLRIKDRLIPRQGAHVFSSGKEIGVVTSGTFSPSLKEPVALAYIETGQAVINNEVSVDIRDKLIQAVVTSKKLL